MKEISMHILDLVQNSIQAQANNIGIEINENQGDDSFVLSITDNGQGMDEITLSRIMDPFSQQRTRKPDWEYPYSGSIPN